MSEAIGALTTVLLTFDVLVVGLGNVGELDRQTPPCIAALRESGGHLS